MFNERKLRAILVLKGRTLEDLANAVGIHKVTLYRKIKENGNFTRDEIVSICEYLEINTKEMKEIFFEENLA